jgi:hypothetical protein
MKERSLEIVDATGGRVMLLDGDVGVQGVDGAMFNPGDIIRWPLLAASLSSYIWRCQAGIWVVSDVSALVSVTGGSSATVDVYVCTGVTAPGSGTTQLTAPIDVQETAPFLALGTLIASPTRIYPGNSVAAVFAGTLTGLVGVLTVGVKRVA